MPSSRHVVEEHKGELALRIEAATLPGLFEEAARALSEAMRGDADGAAAAWSRNLRVSSNDREALLVEWLNELVYQCEAEHVLVTEFHVDRLSDTELEARVRGVRVERLRNPVKAATFHRLSIAEGAGGFTAFVVLDV